MKDSPCGRCQTVCSIPHQEVFSERVKIFRTWKEYENTLNKKREARAKLELQRKLDKIPAVSQEITAVGTNHVKGKYPLIYCVLGKPTYITTV